jgi:hypothetical protein
MMLSSSQSTMSNMAMPVLGEMVSEISLAISCHGLVNLDVISKSDPFVEV